MMLLTMGTSCKKYLDITPDAVGTLDYAFRNRNEAENYLFGCYSTMQRMHNVTANAGFTTSAEIIYPVVDDHPFNTINTGGFNLVRGVQSSGNPVLDYWGERNGGSGIYKAIRRCNIMLENIDKPVDLREAEKKRWIAEVKFLKAYYHYYLIRMYGPVILIKENLPIDGPVEDTKRKRATIDESFAYVELLLNEAIPDLPPIIQNRAREFGRITKFIGMSFKAEVLTTAASPLFNGNPDYTGFKDKDGVALFPATYDPSKWERAAQACKEAIDECEEQGLTLYTRVPPNGVSNVSDELKKVITLQAAITDKWEENSELIWASNYGFSYQGFVTPKLTSLAVSLGNEHPSNWSVPISTAELFYTNNGVPITEDRDWVYASRFTPETGDAANRHYVKEGYQTAKMHLNRERRFYASIGFDGGIWFGNGKTNESDAYYVQARGPAAVSGPKSLYATNITGYWPKKLSNYLSVMDQGFQPSDFKLPFIRLSGLYLLYAETVNEAAGPNAIGIAQEYVDKVRERAGLEGVVVSWRDHARNTNKPNTKDGLREIIHRERRIELCFEGQTGWDLRRWKELQEVLSRPLQGWNIYEESAANYYRPQNVLIPVFGLKDYLWPINTFDVVVNENLVQNPYW